MTLQLLTKKKKKSNESLPKRISQHCRFLISCILILVFSCKNFFIVNININNNNNNIANNNNNNKNKKYKYDNNNINRIAWAWEALVGTDDDDDDNHVESSSMTAAAAAAYRRPPQAEFNITIEMTSARHDRLGSNIKRPFYLLAYAQCKGYHFCVRKGAAGPAEIFTKLPRCNHDNNNNNNNNLTIVGEIFKTPENQSGIYRFYNDDNMLQEILKQNQECMLQPYIRRVWKDIIYSATIFQKDNNNDETNHHRSTVANQQLWNMTTTTTPRKGNKDKDEDTTIKIAVHIRRGDIPSPHPKFIRDEVYLALFRQIKDMLLLSQNQQSQQQTTTTRHHHRHRYPEFHIFSEEHGETNWTGYDEFVKPNHFHLAPQMNNKGGGRQSAHVMDMALNLRDWKHFIEADILIVGGTFSRLASYARDEMDERSGLPLTITPCMIPVEGRVVPCGQYMSFAVDFSGVKYEYYMRGNPYIVKLTNLPAMYRTTTITTTSNSTNNNTVTTRRRRRRT